MAYDLPPIGKCLLAPDEPMKPLEAEKEKKIDSEIAGKESEVMKSAKEIVSPQIKASEKREGESSTQALPSKWRVYFESCENSETEY